MKRPSAAPTCLVDTLLKAKRERAETPTNQPLSPETVAELHRQKSQAQVDHIQRRDAQYTENMDVFRSRS